MEQHFRKSPFIAPLISVCVFISLFVSTGFSQHLTISTTGQTGTSGTNWSISGNTLNVASSGTANIHPNVIANHLNNVGDLTVVLPWQSGQTRDCNILSSIIYTGTITRTLTFRIANDIGLTDANISSTNGALNVILRSAITSAAPDNGRISLLDNNTINTNGGNLWIGGGASDVIWNGLTVGNTGARTWSENVPGLRIRNSTIITGIGNMYLFGISNSSGTPNTGNLNYGIHILNASITSTSGNIEIKGELLGRFTNALGARIESSSTGSSSITTGSGNININGVGSDASSTDTGWRHGLYVSSESAAFPMSITSGSGNITMEGNASFTSTLNDKEGLVLTGNGLKITSTSGNIALKGTNSLESSGQYSNAIRIAADNSTNAIRIGFDGMIP